VFSNFSELLQAVGNSNLDSFSIGTVFSSGENLQVLVENIPSMKIRELGLDIMLPSNNTKRQLLNAVKRNFSLRSLKETSDFGDLELNLADHERLGFYFNRNEHFAEWTENPTTVPGKLWPEALFMAQQASKESLFESLKALSGQGIGLA